MTLKDSLTIILVFALLAILVVTIVPPIQSNKTQIDSLLVENLLLKNKIELLEYKLKHK